MVILSAVFCIFLVLACIVLICLGAVWVEKRYPVEDFDERQKIARGRAYRLSFWTGILYYAGIALVLIQQVDGKKTVEPWLLVIIGVILQAVVLHTYSLLTHAALPMSGKPVATIIGYLFCGGAQLLSFSIHSSWYSVSSVGHGTSSLVFLIAGISFLYLALMYILQLLRDRKE